MPDVTHKSFEDLERNDMHFVLARAGLGVSSFGMQVVDFPAGFDGYPAHDESASGQEEVYVVLRGSGTVSLDGGDATPVKEMDFLRIGPSVHRDFKAGPDGLRMLALAGKPGEAYQAPDWTGAT